MTDLQKKRLKVALSLVAFAWFVWFAPKIVYLNTTRSLPLGIYLAIPGMNLRHGDYVVYDPPDKVKELMLERRYGSEDIEKIIFLKRVGGLPGDVYGVINDEILVNREKKGSVQRQDNAGNPMPVEDGWHLIKEGQFLPLGDKTNSLDGRYTGTAPIGSIRTRVVPVITEW
ncbi:MAG: hypothetical protein E7200_06365 [Selenomonas ruminantium]|nr:hypothetical protein [Selenomonas ruminantium]